MFVLDHFLVCYVDFHEPELLFRVQLLNIRERPHYIEFKHESHAPCIDLGINRAIVEETATRSLPPSIQMRYSRVRSYRRCGVSATRGKAHRRGSSSRFLPKTSHTQRAWRARKRWWTLFVECSALVAREAFLLRCDAATTSNSSRREASREGD